MKGLLLGFTLLGLASCASTPPLPGVPAEAAGRPQHFYALCIAAKVATAARGDAVHTPCLEK